MSALSNPTSRVLDILNFLAAHPTETFTLAEICRHVGLTKASGYRILTTMAEARFLSRHPTHKTYSLGVSAIVIGEAALEKHPCIDTGRKQIALVAESLHAQCSLSTLADGELLLLAIEGVPQSHSGNRRVGERAPAIPPIGFSMMAWRPAEEVEAYLAAAAQSLGPDKTAYLRDALAAIRQRGFAAIAAGPGIAQFSRVSFRPLGCVRDEAYWAAVQAGVAALSRDELQLLDLERPDLPGLAYISAPVFGPTGCAAYEMVVTGLPPGLGPRDIAEHADRLRAACSVVTNAMRGLPPAA